MWIWANHNKTILKSTYYHANKTVWTENLYQISADSIIEMKAHPTEDYATMVKKEGSTEDSWLITLGTDRNFDAYSL